MEQKNDVKKLADQSWEGCDGCTKSDEVIYKNGYVHGYNAAKGGELETFKNQVPEVRKMVEDDVEKLALEWFVTADKRGIYFDLGWCKIFTAGYNKAKETLYTEEQVRKLIEEANYDGQYLHAKSVTSQMMRDNAESYSESIIQSLKQPIHASIDKDFEKDLFQLINDYVKKGLPKSDLVRKMEYVTQSCKMS